MRGSAPVKRGIEVIRQGIALIKRGIEVVRQDFALIKQDFVLVKLDFEVIKLDFMLIKQDFEVIRQDFALIKSDFEVIRQGFALIKSDFTLVKRGIEPANRRSRGFSRATWRETPPTALQRDRQIPPWAWALFPVWPTIPSCCLLEFFGYTLRHKNRRKEQVL